jgi:ketosteroid isomerase-like protein
MATLTDLPGDGGGDVEASAVGLIRRAFELYRERDFDALAGMFHPGVVAVAAVPLGAKHVYTGRDEVLGMLRERESKYAEYESEARSFTATPDGRVLVEGFAHYKPVGGGQGATQVFYWLCEVRDGRIVRWESYTDRGEAKAAAGL